MKLHRLQLHNVKGVTDRCIELPERGVVVLEGRNEVGKTSMLEALDLLIDEKDSSRKRHVLAARPVGQDVASCVEAEMSSGPYRFVYRKQWFKQPATTLTITAPRREHLTGVAAHERVQEILATTTDLDLWRALRLMQATPLNQCDLASSSALAAALDEAAGLAQPTAGAEADTLLASVEAEYRRYFTATGKPTGEYRALSERVERAEQGVCEAQSAVDEVEADVQRHALLCEESHNTTVELERAREDLVRLEQEWGQLSELLDQREQASRARSAATSEANLHRERLEARQALVEKVAARASAAAAAQTEAAGLAAELGPHQEHLGELTERRDAEAAAVASLRHQAAQAEADMALVGDIADLAELVADIERLESALEGRAQARRQFEKYRVDEATLEAVTRTHQAWQLALAEQRAASARMHITALADGQQVTVSGEAATLVQGESLERSLEEPIDLVLADLLSVRIEPEAGAGARADAVAAARAELDAALASAGAADVQEAQRLHHKHREAAAALRAAENDVAAIGAGSGIEERRERREALQAHIEERLAERQDEGLRTDVEQQKGALSQARTQEEASRARLEVLEAQVRAVRDAVQTGLIRLARAETRRDSTRVDAENAEAELRQAREKAADEALETALQSATEAAEQAERAWREVEALVGGRDPELLRVHVAGAQAAVQAIGERQERSRGELLAVQARLSFAGGQGRAEQLDRARSELVHAQREFDSIDRRARAAALLHETMTRHRSEATRAYVEPFGQAVTRLGRVVYGEDFDVEVDRSLCIQARVLDGQRIDYAALSTGAKEQLAILTRLACASLVDSEQGAPVIIDDALGYSDPDKLRRVCSAFSLVGDDAQVLLLTCTPGRYAAIPDAHVIRL
ncbi:ATP-binding protein [Gephyromycinifex aptenodytis]|uniref:ATP-binding protein n=1 Tax=Gephyromycinifex aptenodytis TaxID=2716227 RepID=UPI0014455BB3|nr:hypothetical protein [Gephyromycinifex aptenodytis]